MANVFGAGDGSRTRDLQLGKLSLYQLSYARTPKTAGKPPNIWPRHL